MPNNIKIPKIRQLASGAWSCQLRLDGRSINITDYDYNKVYAKAVAAKSGIIEQRRSPQRITVGDAVEDYIASIATIRSPSTIKEYRKCQRLYFLQLQQKPLDKITVNAAQQAINQESSRVSPKTVKNAWMLVSAAIVYAGGERLNVKLPQVVPAPREYLTPEQIPVLLAAIKGHEYEIPILLGLWSCRRSEILGLTWDNVDLDKRQIKIIDALVQNSDGQYVRKAMPKNKSSIRTIPISTQLYNALLAVDDKTGAVYKGTPSMIYETLQKICADNGLPAIGVHGLRHSFASLAYSLGLPAKVTRQIGGWQTDEVMMRIYTHISERDVNIAAAEITEYFDKAADTGE